MSYEIHYEQHTRFLKAHITGTNSAHAVASYMQDILQECRKRDCFRALMHEDLEGPRLETDDIFRR
jgi:hypothetical protein